jgi:hypothetical protein
MFPSAFLYAASDLLIPEFSACNASGDEKRLKRLTSKVMQLTSYFAVGVSGVIFGFSEEIGKLQGDMNACKILHIEIESDEDMPEFKPFDAKNFDKEFTASSAKFIDDIYARFNQEQFGRLRSGAIGFSGELANDVKREYAEQVTKQQRMITRAYRSVVEHWAVGVLPYQGVQDIMIEPLIKSISDGTN